MPNYNLKNVKILVIEQNSLTLEALIALLQGLGVGHVQSASTINGALEILKQGTLDLVISDWSPGIDGILFLDRVRNDTSNPNPFIPVIFLTAYSDNKQIKKAINAGINDFIAKPFSARHIYKRIIKVIEVPHFFIRSGVYFGPCRRHVLIDNYHNENQRRTSYGGAERRLSAIHMEDDSLPYRPTGD
ncbi:MAG: response regulator [Rhodospirillales bacterium]|nr:response regulator [Rhodospirillales bacterium]